MKTKNPLRGMAMVAAALAGLAPLPGPVAPNAPTGPESNRTQSQARQTMQVTPTATRTSQSQANMGPEPIGYFGPGKHTNLFTFPAWNQRKARRDARRTNRKVRR